MKAVPIPDVISAQIQEAPPELIQPR